MLILLNMLLKVYSYDRKICANCIADTKQLICANNIVVTKTINLYALSAKHEGFLFVHLHHMILYITEIHQFSFLFHIIILHTDFYKS